MNRLRHTVWFVSLLRLPLRARLGDRELAQDVLLALVITLFAQLDLWFNVEQATHYGPDVATALVTLVATSVLVLRRRAPLFTVCVVSTAVALPELVSQLTIQLWGDFVPLLVAVYSTMRLGGRRAAIAGFGVAAAALVVVELRVPVSGGVANIPFIWVPFAIVCAAGRILRARDLAHAATKSHAKRLESEQDETIRVALLEERGRIARELHDIVAHSVSVMVVQAGAAEDLLDRDPERARIPLLSVQETGGHAIGELRRMLGLLRDEHAAPMLAPQPGTSQIGELVGQMSELGLPVDLRVEGTPRVLSPGVELAVFRVVQEALTNTLKHAKRATSMVVLRYGEHELDLEIVDDGAPTHGTGVGHGLIGMRERVALYDGAIEAGPQPEGGFAVRVRLPLTQPTR
jgi:signal transduction histidine kinase